MDGKIRVKMGQIEIECEGSEKFLEKELINILSAISDFYQNAPVELKQAQVSAVPAATPSSNKTPTKNEFDLALNTVATKLHAKTGPDLILAAMARLTFGEDRDVLKASEIKIELKTATQHNSANALKNFTPFIKTLCSSGRVYDKGSLGYAIASETRTELFEQLGL